MDLLLNRIITVFNLEKITSYLIDKMLPDLLVAILIMTVFYVIWRFFQKVVKTVFVRFDADETIKVFILTLLKYMLFLFGLVTALGQVGINTGSILASLGVAGLTIGFAAKDALSNIISGLFIFWDRPFVIGDLIEINNLYGMVDQITMRSTRIASVDGKMIAIPNSQIVNSMVASFTNIPHLRLDIKFTVAVRENLNKISSLIFDLVKEDDYLSEPQPQLVVNAINDYNIELIFQVWINNEREHIRLKFELRKKILSLLLEKNISMPFETLTVNIENDKN